jgi:hypothetical protein
MTFDTLYMLEEFRKIQPDLFDGQGKAYTTVYPYGDMEDMLKLINALESEIIALQLKLAESYL